MCQWKIERKEKNKNVKNLYITDCPELEALRVLIIHYDHC